MGTVMKLYSENEITLTLAKNILEARERAGMTRVELAAKLGCSAQAIIYWETGGREAPHESVVKLAQVFGRNWLWFYQDHSGKAIDTVEIPRSEWERFRQLKSIIGELANTDQSLAVAAGDSSRKRRKSNTKPGYNNDSNPAQTLLKTLSSQVTAGMDPFLLDLRLSPTG